MRHAGFAVALVARADEISHVDGDFWAGRIGKEEDLQPVGEIVFGNAGDGGLLLDALRQSLGECDESRGK